MNSHEETAWQESGRQLVTSLAVIDDLQFLPSVFTQVKKALKGP